MLLSGLTACWSPRYGDHEWEAVVAELADSTATRNPDSVGARILRGFDPLGAADDVTPRAGDRLLYRLDYDTPSRTERRYLLIRVPEATPGGVGPLVSRARVTHSDGSEQILESRLRRVDIELFDRDGASLGSSMAQAPYQFLAAGFARACAEFQAVRAGELDEARMQHPVDVFVSCLAIGQLLKEDPILEDIVAELVDWTLGFSVLWNFGLALHLDSRVSEALKVASGYPGAGAIESFRLPVELKINGYPALQLSAHTIEPRPPLSLVAGLMSATGIRPSDDRYRFALQLISARRGKR